MYYAPSRPIEIEKFPKGYIKPTGQNLEFLQRPPEDNRRIQDYYGKVEDLHVQQDRPQKVIIQGTSEQPEQLPQEKKQENGSKDNQNQDQNAGSNVNPQRVVPQEKFQSAPYNTIYTDENIYKPVGTPQNFAQSILQPQGSRISQSNIRGPDRGYVHGFRGFSQDFQEPGFGYFPQDFRDDIPSEELGLPLSGYRRMASPGILSDCRRGIPEPILSKRYNGRELRGQCSYRVFPINDFRRGPPVEYYGPPPQLNERNGQPFYERGYPYFDYDRQRFEPPFEQRTFYDPRAVPPPDYYVPEYRGFPPIGMQREFNERVHYNRSLPYQDRLYPPSYGRINQQLVMEGRPDYNYDRFYPPYEERANEQNQRIKQV
ncbi:unnamed protein product [Paramecium octaurelia]|uniref:Uncharacterized protein n=1 Tax=Paramecium octaurelia TaxID=43137 RepID=A0A8S1TBY3_PAROT|nr:unnamed protein product [Paramecium octaurelia]